MERDCRWAHRLLIRLQEQQWMSKMCNSTFKVKSKLNLQFQRPLEWKLWRCLWRHGKAIHNLRRDRSHLFLLIQWRWQVRDSKSSSILIWVGISWSSKRSIKSISRCWRLIKKAKIHPWISKRRFYQKMESYSWMISSKSMMEKDPLNSFHNQTQLMN